MRTDVGVDRPGCRWNDGIASFSVWAPHARSVSVALFRPDQDAGEHLVEMQSADAGWWQVQLEADAGDEYRFRITTADGEVVDRMDPRARQVTNSVGRCVVLDESFDWQVDDFVARPVHEWVIYELHPSTFAGTLDDVVERFDHLIALGVTCVELMPVAEFAGDVSWGYNPALPFAVESSYGGPAALKRLVDAAHGRDLDLWRFDGWHDGDGGGIYFYNDWRSDTAWGHTRPDYGRDEVRQFLIDNALMWLQDYRLDGLRLDSTVNIRNAHGEPGPDGDLDDGWRFLADLNDTVHAHCPGAIMIAEDLQQHPAVTHSTTDGGLGFDLQWAADFVHPVRAALETIDDGDRDLDAIAIALTGGDAFRRVVYSESHDEVANGRTRVPAEIDPDDPDSWPAIRRAALGAVLVMTAPDVPMIFQGQEWADEDVFDDQRQLDWSRAEDRRGISQMWAYLIGLRTGTNPVAGGLRGDQIDVHHRDTDRGVLAWLRWGIGGSDDATLVVCNFSTHRHEDITIGVPVPGNWHARFDSTWSGYHDSGNDVLDGMAAAEADPADGQPHHITVTLDAYGAAIFTPESGD